jgi:hypothetical protein
MIKEGEREMVRKNWQRKGIVRKRSDTFTVEDCLAVKMEAVRSFETSRSTY